MQSQQKKVFPVFSDEMIKARNKTGMPDWEVAVYSDGEKIFLCGSLYAREREIMLLTHFDGVGIVYANGHIYAPTDWLKDVFPGAGEHLRQLEETIRAKLPKKA